MNRAMRIGAAAGLLAFAGVAGAQPDLASGFAAPPQQARPHTWWHWMNGNITREGITADLEAIKQVGLGGVQMFNVSESIPKGPILYNSPEWRDLVKFAASEAKRLGLEMCFHNCAGWSSSGGPWVTPEHAMQKVVFSEVAVDGPKRLAEKLPVPEAKLGFYRDIAVLAFPTPENAGAKIPDLRAKAGYDAKYNQAPSLAPVPMNAVVARNSIVDLTAKLKPDGTLEWEAPAGKWTVVRLGYSPTGAVNAPAADSGRGLECDKMSRDGLDAHWAGGVMPLLKDLGPLAGSTVGNCLIDSYEVGGQNWTAKFREEFSKRRGYDPLPMIVTLTGRYVGSGEESERFLWDFRRTIADLFADNYYSYFAELCHKSGMKASIEPYDGPFECLLSGRDADIPMGEFWVNGGMSSSCRLAASVGHTYGRPIIGAESFTAEPSVGKWQNHPYTLKAVGDLMYTVGINRYIIHRYTHQPWMNVVPGMTMGQWGTHFERTTTWWTQGAAWVQYLSRCQYLLQQGTFAADVCYFSGEAGPGDAPFQPELKAKGYDYDACNADVLTRRLSVKDGRLAIPDGPSYRVLVLPDSPFLTPGTLGRIKELAMAGATVIGPRPNGSPSLSGYPACDSDVHKLADELWGVGGGKGEGERAVGKGKMVWGRTPEAVLAATGVGPDCEFGKAGKMAWIHRHVGGAVAGGDAEVYFVSNQMARSREVECSFRVNGLRPELWHADTGEMEPAPLWSEREGRTVVPVRFDPSGSVFVVFRAKASGPHFASVRGPGETEQTKAPKIEIKSAVYEAKDGAGGVDVTQKVAAMAAGGETSIPANNAAFGDPAYLHLKRLRVEYVMDGKPMSASADENAGLELTQAPGPERPAGYMLRTSTKGDVSLLALETGTYEFSKADGKKEPLDIKSLPAPVAISGPWTVQFQPGRGAPASVTMDALESWTASKDAGVKYFSGTAEYEKEFEVPGEVLGSGRALLLDLGSVREIAEVSVNGHDLGVWWKPPFTADVAGFVKPGKNTLKVRVTNLWTNRLIGDEQYPDDCEWNGKPITKWPDWFVKGEKRPVPERLTFTTWKHYTKDSPLLDSGLLGPVVLRPGRVVAVPVE